MFILELSTYESPLGINEGSRRDASRTLRYVFFKVGKNSKSESYLDEELEREDLILVQRVMVEELTKKW